MLLNETHLNLAREIALQSPCVRRKYGVVITNGIDTVATNNYRVSTCCNDGCVRENMSIEHATRTDVGAEVHAEQAALIRWAKPIDKYTKVLIQGFYKAETTPREGVFLYPCHTCAGMLKFAGFKFIHLGLDTAVSLSEVLEYWEEGWENPTT